MCWLLTSGVDSPMFSIVQKGNMKILWMDCWNGAVRYGSVKIRNGSFTGRYGSFKIRYGSLKVRYGSLKVRHGSWRGHYGTFNIRYGSLKACYESFTTFSIFDACILQTLTWCIEQPVKTNGPLADLWSRTLLQELLIYLPSKLYTLWFCIPYLSARENGWLLNQRYRIPN